MKITFIVCTYSRELLFDTFKCLYSLINQDYRGSKEILLVMDKDEELYNMFNIIVPKSVNILLNEQPGLSNARNTGIKHATGDIIVFIDDDAFADKQFATNLIKNYKDENVIGTAGKILPDGIPNYPEELWWIGGFTNKGYAETRCEVRNAYGCNMSFRKVVFKYIMFNADFGRIGKKLVTCEETEFSMRALNMFNNSKIIYDPSIVVYHKVHKSRQTFMYMIKRAYYEGKSKAQINRLYNDKHNSTENTYLNFLLTKAIPKRVQWKDIIHNTKEIVSILAVIISVGIGYTVEKIK